MVFDTMSDVSGTFGEKHEIENTPEENGRPESGFDSFD